jgi:hypothetical protein
MTRDRNAIIKLVRSVPLVRKRTRWSKFSLLYNDAFLSLIISRVQMKSWAGKALETVNCYAFLKRSSWSMLTANLKFRAKKFFLSFFSLQCLH